MLDVYFTPNWGQVHASVEGGEVETFEHETDYGAIRHMFIRRSIPGDHPVQLWDITTPYGYGGPLVTDAAPGRRQLLVESFAAAFRTYCLDTKIVSEFVRFHPLVNNAADFQRMYSLSPGRKTVSTRLDIAGDVMANFSKSCRKNIRRALSAGVTGHIVEAPKDLCQFRKIYHSTMDRNQAAGFYYFGDDYFERFVEELDCQLVCVEARLGGEVIAMNLCMVSRDVIHIHLSGTLPESLHLSPAYILRHKLAQWGQESGLKLIHHGGGRTDSDEDPLYRFKKQFGEDTSGRFHVGRRIWNPEAYGDVCQAAGVPSDLDGYFPAYRNRNPIGKPLATAAISLPAGSL